MSATRQVAMGGYAGLATWVGSGHESAFHPRVPCLNLACSLPTPALPASVTPHCSARFRSDPRPDEIMSLENELRALLLLKDKMQTKLCFYPTMIEHVCPPYRRDPPLDPRARHTPARTPARTPTYMHICLSPIHPTSPVPSSSSCPTTNVMPPLAPASAHRRLQAQRRASLPSAALRHPIVPASSHTPTLAPSVPAAGCEPHTMRGPAGVSAGLSVPRAPSLVAFATTARTRAC